MKTYRMHEGEIAIPAQWRDRTMQMWVLPQTTGGEASLVITRDAETRAGSIEDYADQQLAEGKQRLKAFRLVDRQSRVVGGRPAVQVDYLWTSPQNLELRQRQAYTEWEGYYLIFTLTARPGDFGQQETVWRDALESVRLREQE